MILFYKLCKYKLCGKCFERPEGISNHNWKITAYCCRDHQIKHSNTHKSKLCREPRQKKKSTSSQKEKKHQDELKGSKTSNWQPFICSHV